MNWQPTDLSRDPNWGRHEMYEAVAASELRLERESWERTLRAIRGLREVGR